MWFGGDLHFVVVVWGFMNEIVKRITVVRDLCGFISVVISGKRACLL